MNRSVLHILPYFHQEHIHLFLCPSQSSRKRCHTKSFDSLANILIGPCTQDLEFLFFRPGAYWPFELVFRDVDVSDIGHQVLVGCYVLIWSTEFLTCFAKQLRPSVKSML